MTQIEGICPISGTVTELRGSSARILVRRSAACEGCNGCGILGGSLTDMTVEADITGFPSLQPGDQVELESLGGGLILNSMLVYGFPLAGFMGGILGGTYFGFGEFQALLTGVGTMIFLFIPAVLTDRRLRQTRKPLFKVVGLAD